MLAADWTRKKCVNSFCNIIWPFIHIQGRFPPMIPALTTSAPASGGPYATLEKKCWVLLLSLVCLFWGEFFFVFSMWINSIIQFPVGLMDSCSGIIGDSGRKQRFRSKKVTGSKKFLQWLHCLNKCTTFSITKHPVSLMKISLPSEILVNVVIMKVQIF